MLNKATLIGNLGTDPEVRHAPSGSTITNITLATSRRWKDKVTGEKKEQTEWHRVIFFNRLAEVAGEYLKKGSQVYIQGRIQTRKWQDQSGQDKYTTEIIAEEMQMIGNKGGNNQAAGNNSRFENAADRPSSQAQPVPAADFPDDDIPF